MANSSANGSWSDWFTNNIVDPTENFFWRVGTGTVSPQRLGQIQAEEAAAIRQAGGTEADVTAAGNELSNFVSQYWPARGPLGTLLDDLKGDPLGLHRAPDHQDDPAPDLTFLVLIGIALVLGVFVLDALIGN